MDNLNHSNARLITLATKGAVAVACALVTAKAIAWMWTDSLSLQASLVDSFLDLGGSVINFFVVRHALKPADEEHRFGHGKLEALGSLGQSTFIAGSAVWLLFEGVHRIFHPMPVQQGFWGSLVMIFAIVLTAGLLAFQHHVIKKTRSLAITADSLHYQSDLYMNIGVLISLNVAYLTGWSKVDVVVGAGIAFYVLYTSYAIGRQSVDVLMDRELPDSDRERLLEIALSHPEVMSVHDLRTRSSGQKDFVQMHLDMRPELSLMEAHDVAAAVKDLICTQFPQADVLIHQDPYDPEHQL